MMKPVFNLAANSEAIPSVQRVIVSLNGDENFASEKG